MGKKAPKAPAAPDPVATAQAQGAVNKETAIANARLNNVNQYTPYGSLLYTEEAGPDGTPRFTSRINLSPEQQKLLELNNKADIGTAQLGVDQLGRINTALSTPYSYDGLPEVFGGASQEEAIRRAEEAINSRLGDRFNKDEESLRTRLLNQGIGQGSEAYTREFDTLNKAKTDARMQAILGAQQYSNNALNESLARRQQAIQEYSTRRNAPLNELTALLSGSQVQNPQFQNTSYQGAAPADIAGQINQNYQAQVGQYNSKVAARNATQGSLLGLGGQLASAYLFKSDIRFKENIRHTGVENGHNIYEFSYKGDDKRYIGVMAQEVQQTNPDAVHEINGFLYVDYGALGIEMREAV